MPINPFDEKGQFTCPRCGKHESSFDQIVVPARFVCNNPYCDYDYVREPDPAPKEAATIRVGRWWRHRNSNTIVRVYRVDSWPSCQTGEPDHQEVWFETSDGTKRQDRLLDTIFLEYYVPNSQPGNEHGQEEIKTDSRDAATIDEFTQEVVGQIVGRRMSLDRNDVTIALVPPNLQRPDGDYVIVRAKPKSFSASLLPQFPLDRSVVDLAEALDLISGMLAESPGINVSASNICPCCEAYDKCGDMEHASDCKGALFLRKHGRVVRIEGDA